MVLKLALGTSVICDFFGSRRREWFGADSNLDFACETPGSYFPVWGGGKVLKKGSGSCWMRQICLPKLTL